MTKEIVIDFTAIYTLILFIVSIITCIDGIKVLRMRSIFVPIVLKPLLVINQIILGKQTANNNYEKLIEFIGPHIFSLVLLSGSILGIVLSVLYFISINFSIIKISEFQ